MNGVSNYPNNAYNSYFSYSITAVKTDDVKKSEQPAKTDTAKSSGVSSLLGTMKNGPVTTTQSEKYGTVVGEPKLSEKAADYYNSLKKKYGNMDFVLVSKDQINAAKSNAASFGNPNKPVVLIDEEKLEKMATDESFRKKYEGIISMSQSKLAEMAKSFAGNSSITGFGMNVDKNGKTSFFATVSDTSKGQKERIEKARAEKKQEAKRAEKKTEKKLEEKRNEKAKVAKEKEADRLEKRRTETIKADSIEELIKKVQERSYTATEADIRSEAELAVGGSVDFSA